MNEHEKQPVAKTQKLFARYCCAISRDFGIAIGNQEALNANAIDFCSECGCVVYRRDIHDEWHKRTDNPEAKA